MSAEEKQAREERIQEMKNKPFPGVRFISCVLAFFVFAFIGIDFFNSYMHHRTIAIKKKQKEEQRRFLENHYKILQEQTNEN